MNLGKNMQYYVDTDDIREYVKEVIDYLNISDNWVVIIEPYKEKRSNAQNRFYWSYIRIMSRHFGMEDDELHEVLCAEFLGVKQVQFRGREYTVRKSSAKLTKKEFTEFLEKVMAMAANEGLNLPV